MTNQSPVAPSERQNYEQAISKLSQANSLQKFLLWLIAILLIIAVFVLWQSKISQDNAAQAARDSQQAVLNEIKNQGIENGKNTQRVLDYINCVITTPPDADNVQELIKACYNKAAPPPVSRSEVDVGSNGLAVTPQQAPTTNNSSGGRVALNPQPGNGNPQQPGNPPSSPPAEPPGNGEPPEEPPAEPEPPSVIEVLTGTVEGLTCNKTVMLLCSQ